MAEAVAEASRRDAARADLCRFVAACYYQPGPEFTEERLFEALAAAAAEVDADLAATAHRLGQAWADTDPTELLVDYTRLFLGPVKALAQPYASVWLSGENLVMQASTVSVKELYEEGGFEIDEAFQDLPDHVAVELEFLYLMNYRELESRSAGDPARAEKYAALKRRFLDQHLGVWLGSFLEALHREAQTGFYELLAELTERLVRLEGLPQPQPRGI